MNKLTLNPFTIINQAIRNLKSLVGLVFLFIFLSTSVFAFGTSPVLNHR